MSDSKLSLDSITASASCRLFILFAVFLSHFALFTNAGFDIVGYTTTSGIDVIKPLFFECVLAISFQIFVRSRNSNPCSYISKRDLFLAHLGFIILSFVYIKCAYQAYTFDKHIPIYYIFLIIQSAVIFAALIWISNRLGREKKLSPSKRKRCHFNFYLAFWNIVQTSIYVLFAYHPDWCSHNVGSIGVVLLAFSCWVGWFALWARSRMSVVRSVRFPLWIKRTVVWAWTIPVVCFAYGLSLNNHTITLMPIPLNDRVTQLHDHVDTNTAIQKWAKINRNAQGHATMVLIATAGGGVRAAYWTASVLNELNHIRNFRKSVFAISSVSGGSLGAALYRSYLTNVDNGNLKCAISSEYDCYRDFFSEDFLAPVLAGWLFSDTLRNLLPFIETPDRSEALERSWSSAWQQAFSSDIFSHAFMTQWHGAGRPSSTNTDADDLKLFPSLILNVTALSTGLGDTISNIGETKSVLSWAPISLSTAVNTSARFPILEPPGMLPLNELNSLQEIPGLWPLDPYKYAIDYFVDGGYFDNFGATEIEKILSAVNKINCGSIKGESCAKAPDRPWISTMVIQITSDQAISVYGYNSGRCLNPPEISSPWMIIPRSDMAPFLEFFSPLIVFENARVTRGLYISDRISKLSDYYLHFRLSTSTVKEIDPFPYHEQPEDARPPFASLNWVLSPTSKHQIDGRITQCGRLRRKTLEKLLNGTEDINEAKNYDYSHPKFTDDWEDDN